MKKLLSLIILLLVCSIASAQIITTIAGNGFNAYSGDGGPATAASIFNPYGVAADHVGNVYIVDTKNHCIRKVNSAGTISTIAGDGTAGYSGDGGPAIAAHLYLPTKIILDGAGNILFVDNSNFRIRKISTSGIISTIVGTGVAGNTGDGGPATAAQINGSPGLAVDAAGNIYFSDVTKNTIRKINTSGIVSTIAGCGLSGYMGDGGPATSSKLNRPMSVVVDQNNEIYIADHNNSVVRKISNTGIITTIAGSGVSGYSGDGGPATAAQLRGPSDVYVDPTGSLLIADYVDSRIRKIDNVVAVPVVGLKENIAMRVFPNPCHGRCFVNISAPQTAIIDITVSDLLGRRVFTKTAETNTEVPLDLHVPNGVYVVTVVASGAQLTEKMYLIK